MKNYEEMLRRIDRKIDQRRRDIRDIQVEIVQLEESHKTLMLMAEEDIALVEEQRRTGASRRLMNGTPKPLLIAARKPPPQEDAPAPPQEDAPLGIVRTGKRKGLPRLRRGRAKSKSVAQLIDSVLRTLAGGEAMTQAEMANYLGIAADTASRKQFTNTIYRMHKTGKISLDGEHRYSLAEA